MQHIGLTALVVADYDEALRFFVGTLGFELIEDTYIPGQDKRFPRGQPDWWSCVPLLMY